MNSFFHKVMAKIVKWLDPKLVKFRTPEKKIPFTPKDEKEFIGVLKRTPKNILSDNQRNLIAGAMTFDQIPVSEIMTERADIMLLNESDFLGPLLLDKMFKTGLTHFPVLDKEGNVFGYIDTEDIDPLKITEDQPLDHYINKKVYFARADYSLKMLLATFLRSDCTYCIVVNKEGRFVGAVTMDTLIAVLFGHHIRDTFDNDASPLAVAQRTEK